LALALASIETKQQPQYIEQQMDTAFKISGPLSSFFLLYILPYSPSSPNPSPVISQKVLKAQGIYKSNQGWIGPEGS